MTRTTPSVPREFALVRGPDAFGQREITMMQLEDVKSVRRRGMVGHSTVYRAIQRGDLTPIKLGRATRFDAAEVDKWLSGGATGKG